RRPLLLLPRRRQSPQRRAPVRLRPRLRRPDRQAVGSVAGRERPENEILWGVDCVPRAGRASVPDREGGIVRHRYFVSFLVLLSFVLSAAVSGQQVIGNWSAPAAWSAPRGHGVTTQGDITSPLPFIAVTPCRVADTRGNGFAGQYGPPALAANANRNF